MESTNKDYVKKWSDKFDKKLKQNLNVHKQLQWFYKILKHELEKDECVYFSDIVSMINKTYSPTLLVYIYDRLSSIEFASSCDSKVDQIKSSFVIFCCDNYYYEYNRSDKIFYKKIYFIKLFGYIDTIWNVYGKSKVVISDISTLISLLYKPEHNMIQEKLDVDKVYDKCMFIFDNKSKKSLQNELLSFFESIHKRYDKMSYKDFMG